MTCNKVLHHIWPFYEAYVTERDGSWEGVWDYLEQQHGYEIERDCCKTMFCSNVELSKLICTYNPADVEIIYRQRQQQQQQQEKDVPAQDPVVEEELPGPSRSQLVASLLLMDTQSDGVMMDLGTEGAGGGGGSGAGDD